MRAVIVAISLVTVAVPSVLVATENHLQYLTVNPIIQKLLTSKGTEAVATLEGYIGPSIEGTVRIYTSLTMESYMDIPKDTILYSMPIADDKEGRVRVFVKASTEVNVVSIRHTRVRASAASRMSQRARASTCRSVERLAAESLKIIDLARSQDEEDMASDIDRAQLIEISEEVLDRAIDFLTEHC